jgi:hypothetical protein
MTLRKTKMVLVHPTTKQVYILTECADDAALRFGIRFTTKQYHKTMLLKSLRDANASHYLSTKR